jgi:hypothetical protein
MLIKKEWWSVRGDLDLFRYQAGFVPVPEVDRSSAEVTAMWTDNKNLEAENMNLEAEVKRQRDEIRIHKARIQAHAAKINNLETEVDRLRRENEEMKAEIRRGRMPVIDADTAVNEVGRETSVDEGKGGAIEEEGGVTMRLNEEEDKEQDEKDDVFKRMFANDRLVKSIMRFL